MRLLDDANGEIEQIVNRVKACMVRVENRGRGAGAGTVWHPEGLIMTNAHVAAGRQLSVWDSTGKRTPARLLAADANLDLAALSVEASGLQSIELGSTDIMRPGELVFAMGFPWGVEGGLTAGVFIGLESWWPNRGRQRREWVMASLHLRPGHSGGPMVNSNGKLIGINTIMRGPDVGVAIPVETVERFLKSSLGRHRKAA
jgi:serine protease Do